MKITKYQQASTLWLEYQQALRNYIRSRVKDEDTTNEITQQVLMKIYGTCCTDREIQKVDAWLFRIAHNAVADYWQTQKKISHDLPDVLQEDDKSVWSELVEYVEPLINLLPEMYARPLYLSDIEGLKQSEIATQLNLGISATKSRIQRGRELLQKEILTCCNTETDNWGNIVGFSVKESCTPLQQLRKKTE